MNTSMRERSTAESAKLVGRVLAMSFLAIPGAGITVFVATLAFGVIIGLFERMGLLARPDGPGWGISLIAWMILVLGPSLVTGYLIICHHAADAKGVRRRDWKRAALWAGGLLPLSSLSAWLGVVPERAGMLIVPAILAVPVAVIAELTEWP